MASKPLVFYFFPLIETDFKWLEIGMPAMDGEELKAIEAVLERKAEATFAGPPTVLYNNMNSNRYWLTLSLFLTAANISGSSGMMAWAHASKLLGMSNTAIYTPVIIYLLGLSAGCIGLGLYNKNRSYSCPKKRLKLLILSLIAVSTLTLINNCVGSNTVDCLLRFCWGFISGLVVITARAMLITPNNDIVTRRNFSSLSLVLASLPIFLPATLQLIGLTSKSDPSALALLMYLLALTSTYYLEEKTSKQLEANYRRPAQRSCTAHKSYLTPLINLIILNTTFFTALLLFPFLMLSENLSPSLAQAHHSYVILLALCLPLGWITLKHLPSLTLKSNVRIGILMLLTMLAITLYILANEAYILILASISLAWLCAITIQPLLFHQLGSTLANPTYLYGIQSGVYVLVTATILIISITATISLKMIVLSLSVLVALSLALTLCASAQHRASYLNQ